MALDHNSSPLIGQGGQIPVLGNILKLQKRRQTSHLSFHLPSSPTSCRVKLSVPRYSRRKVSQGGQWLHGDLRRSGGSLGCAFVALPLLWPPRVFPFQPSADSLCFPLLPWLPLCLSSLVFSRRGCTLFSSITVLRTNHSPCK